MEDNKNFSAEDVDKKFQMIENKFLYWECCLKMKFFSIEQEHQHLKYSLGSAIVGNPIYKMTSLHSFLTDMIGVDYCSNYTQKDWQRHYEIESLKNRR